MSFLGDVLGFESFNAKEMFGQVKDKPQRLLMGSADPFSTKMWNGVTGSDDKPIVNEWGGATDDRYKDAEAKGIDTKAGGTMHGIAQSIAGMFAGNYAKGAAGNMFGGSAPAGGTPPLQSPSTQPNPYDFNPMGGGPKAPPQMSPATQPNPYDVNLGATAGGTDWAGVGKAVLQGVGSSMGGGKEESQPMSAPPVTGGQYFTVPKGNMSDNRIGGAPKGILAQNYQL